MTLKLSSQKLQMSAIDIEPVLHSSISITFAKGVKSGMPHSPTLGRSQSSPVQHIEPTIFEVELDRTDRRLDLDWTDFRLTQKVHKLTN